MPRRSWKERLKEWKSSRLLQGITSVLAILLIGFGWMVFDSYRTQAIIQDWQDRGITVDFSSESPDWLKQMGPQVESMVRIAVSFRSVHRLKARCKDLPTHDKQTLFTSADVRNLERMTELKDLTIENYAVTDQDLACIGKLSKLMGLSIKCSNVSDSGISQLRKLKHLKSIFFTGTMELSPSGFGQLAELPELEILFLGDAPITDEGVADISRIKSLDTLELDSSRLTKAGVQHLEQFRNLKRLYINNPGRHDLLMIGLESRMREQRKQVYFGKMKEADEG